MAQDPELIREALAGQPFLDPKTHRYEVVVDGKTVQRCSSSFTAHRAIELLALRNEQRAFVRVDRMQIGDREE